MIRNATDDDAMQLARIYNYYVLNTIITFEEQAVTEQDIQARISEAAADNLPYLVAENSGVLVGYAYASKWKGRCAYKHSAEVTVYVKHGRSGSGLGSQLYDVLFEQLRARSVHVAIGGIALPNPASVALHEKFGMQQVAHFKEIGFKFDRWVDVGYWQTVLRGD